MIKMSRGEASEYIKAHPTNWGVTALMRAADRGDVEGVRLLARCGAAADEEGETICGYQLEADALVRAVVLNHAEAAGLLVEHGKGMASGMAWLS